MQTLPGTSLLRGKGLRLNGALVSARSLSHSELAPLRVPLVPMEHCTSRFFQECDADKDKQVSFKEWTSCFGIRNGESNSMFLYFLNCTQDPNSNDRSLLRKHHLPYAAIFILMPVFFSAEDMDVNQLF